MNSLRKLWLSGCGPVGLASPVEGVRHLLYAVPDTYVACAQLPQPFVETGKHHVRETLLQTAVFELAQALKHHPDVQRGQVETAIDRVQNMKARVEDRLARPGDNAAKETLCERALGARFTDSSQHEDTPRRSCAIVAGRLAKERMDGRDAVEEIKSMKLPLLSTAACLIVLGCTPVIDQRGYLPDPEVESKIVVGDDTKTTIQQRLGYPSTEATFGTTTPGTDAWYYISSIEKTVAFFNPSVKKRQILAVYFDKDGKVTDLKHYALKDGNVVAFETRTTPAKGRELTFLQQLFNATPGVPLGGAGQQQNPGGGGGPPTGGGGGGYP